MPKILKGEGEVSDDVSEIIEATLDKIEQVRGMGPKVRYKIGMIIWDLLKSK